MVCVVRSGGLEIRLRQDLFSHLLLYHGFVYIYTMWCDKVKVGQISGILISKVKEIRHNQGMVDHRQCPQIRLQYIINNKAAIA